MGIEFDILYWFQSISNSILDNIMIGFTSLGNAGILWIVLSVLFLCTKKYRKCGITMGLALIFSLIMCNGFMKNLVARDRPCWIDPSVQLLIKNPTDFSFPSGHTSASFAAAVVMFMYHKKAGIVALIVAANIAISRIYLFVHFPTDVLASLVLGSLYGVIAYFVIRMLCKRFVKFSDWVAATTPATPATPIITATTVNKEN